MMKKIALILFMTMLTSTAFAAPLVDHFYIQPITGVYTAGTSPINVNVFARDAGDNNLTSYSGSVSFSASVGYVGVSATGTNISTSFTSGQWTGTIYMTGAGNPVTLTVTDLSSSAAGSTTVTVNTGAYSNLLIITDGMSYAPGMPGGYTGYALSQTATLGFSVTVAATDAFYNIVTSSDTVILLSGCTYAVTPPIVTGASLSTGFAYFNITVSPSVIGNCQITAEDYTKSFMSNMNIYFNSLSAYFLWANAPISVIAGVPFPVTITMSNADKGNPIGGNHNWSSTLFFQNPLVAGLTPVPTPNNIVSVSTGSGVAMLTFTKRDNIPNSPIIEIVPEYTCCDTSISPTCETSNGVDVYANTPTVCSFTAAQSTLAKGQTTNLTAFVQDSFQNPVSYTPINFAIISGTGTLSSGTGTTDFTGNTTIVFTAPDSNTRTVISAQVQGMSTAQTVMIICSLSTPDSHKFISRPNPFAAGKESAEIDYYLDYDSNVKFYVYNVFGGLLWKKEMSKGSDGTLAGGNSIMWDGRTDNGYMAGSGLYLLRMTVSNSNENYTIERNIVIKK